MAEEIVNKHIIFEFVYEKKPLESVKMKNWFRHDPTWPKGLEPKFHDAGTSGGFGKCEQSDR